jgi:hypothetical protein
MLSSQPSPVQGELRKSRPEKRPLGLRVALALVGPTSLSVLSLVFAATVAAVTWFAFSFDQGFLCTAKDVQTHGVAVEAAVGLVLFGGLLEALFVLFLCRRRTAFLGTLLLATGTLGLAMTLVAFDSATWSWIDTHGDCGSETHHVGYLYALWGAPLALLLLQAGRLVRERRRSRQTRSAEPRLRSTSN